MSQVERLSLRRYGASRGSHAHDHFQVLVGLGGVLELEVEGRGRRIAAGDGCVVAPGDRHDFEAVNGSHCLVLDTRHAAWTGCCEQAPPARAALLLANYLGECLANADAHILALQHGPRLLLEAWSPRAESSQRPRRRIDWPALGDWAAAHWQEPVQLADMAAVACLSASQFAQRCRDEQGMSPMQWLRAQRLVQARRLRQGGMSAAEAARRTGYRSPSALTAAMRRSDTQR